MKKKSFCMLFAVFLLSVPLFITGCLDDGGTSKPKASFADAYGKDDSWVIEWYVCGTDLESKYGAATADIEELLDTKLPDNVKVVIQTGGAEKWRTKGIKKSKIGRFLYDKDGLHEIVQEKDADMGASATLENFLRFSQENYGADHRVLVLWDHGGGSAAGVCYDERTGNMMRLNDIRRAIEAVHPASEQPPYELVGFDACLMSTYDTANTLSGLSRYMVASEEVEPGNGWYYTGWIGALAKNPAMGGAGLGQAICDSYMEGCESVGTEDEATLCVIDLSKLPRLKEAYEAFGVEALQQASNHPKKFFSAFGREAKAAENYGGNTRDQGYSDMVDLADLAKGAERLLPKTSKQLVDAVDEAVIYKVNGDYRTQGSGISGFHSYDNDENVFALYAAQNAAPLPQKCLYYYLLYGEMPDVAKELIRKGITAPAPATQTVTPSQGQAKKSIIDIKALDDFKVDIDKDGNSFVKLSEEQMDLISTVHCNLVYLDIAKDLILYLGSDTDIDSDWDKGIFKDNFRGVWPMLDGHPIFIEITADEEDYNLYAIPIKLNGEECNLQVSYTYKDQKYHVLGARKGIDSHGMADRNLIKIKKGDKITTIHYAMSISGDDEDFTPVEVDTFTVGDKLTLADEEVGNGNYGYMFEFTSPTGENAYSDMVQFAIQNGEITTTVNN